MDEYIERGALLKRFETHNTMKPETIGKKQFAEGYYLGLREAVIMVAQACAVDVEPVRHGWWVPISESEITGWNPEFAGRDPVGDYQCSVCGKEAIFDCNDEFVLSRYCPHCGAKMDTVLP